MALARPFWPQAQRQRLFPVQALNAFVVYRQALTAQQQIEPWTPEPPAFLSQFSQTPAQILVTV